MQKFFAAEFQTKLLVPERQKPIYKALYARAETLSKDPAFHIKDIVNQLATTALRDHGILANEFLTIFQDGISELIVKNYITSLKDEASTTPSLDEEGSAFKEAKASLRAFVEHYSETEVETVGSHLRKLKRKHKGLNTGQLFDDEMEHLLLEKVNDAAGAQTHKLLEDYYRLNPNRFFRENILPRIVILSSPFAFTNKENLEKSLEFMAEQGPLNDIYLYMAVYEWLKNHPIFKNQQDVAAAVGEVNQTGDPTPLSFDQFFNFYFPEAIKAIRRKQVEREDTIGTFDVIGHTPADMRRMYFPPEAIMPFVRETSAFRDPERRMTALRYNFDAFNPNLPDAEVEAMLARGLEAAAASINEVSEQSVKKRQEDDPIRQDYRYIDEIIECRDVVKLRIWLTSPQDFLEGIGPERADVLIKKYGKDKIRAVITFESRRMLELLMVYRDICKTQKYKTASEHRDLFEENMLQSMQIERKDIDEKTLDYCIGVKTGDNGVKEWKVIKNGITEGNIPNEMFDQSRQKTIEYEGYKYSPMEQATFGLAKGKILSEDYRTYHSVDVWFFMKNGRFVDVKSELSAMSNYYREAKNGKDYDATDQVRCAIAINDPHQRNRVRRHFLRAYTENAKKIIDRVGRGNKVVRNIKKVALKDHNSISAKTDLKLSGYAMVPVRKPDGGWDEVHVNAEMQLFDVDEMLIYWASKHGPLSHEEKYTPEREFANAELLYPPNIFGEKFAEYRLGGFDGKAAAGE